MATKRDELQEVFEGHELLFMDGFDDAILGVAVQFNKVVGVAYDREKIRDSLIKEGMSFHEAEEYMSFNQEGAWVGEYTPVFIHSGE